MTDKKFSEDDFEQEWTYPLDIASHWVAFLKQLEQEPLQTKQVYV